MCSISPSQNSRSLTAAVYILCLLASWSFSLFSELLTVRNSHSLASLLIRSFTASSPPAHCFLSINSKVQYKVKFKWTDSFSKNYITRDMFHNFSFRKNDKYRYGCMLGFSSSEIYNLYMFFTSIGCIEPSNLNFSNKVPVIILLFSPDKVRALIIVQGIFYISTNQILNTFSSTMNLLWCNGEYEVNRRVYVNSDNS